MNLPPILSNPFVLLALAILGPLVKDLVVGLLRASKQRMLTDGDPKNDDAAKILGDAADAIEKLKIHLGK